ncbi:hypothetical protein [Lactobacillus jensenii]|uniref:hypothetical protein n=1 Tax=Lactobacillus jensenii TaxID=109790 RepID=UPI0036F49C68
MFYKDNDVYKQCKQVINVNSDTYKNYRKDVNTKLNEILAAFTWTVVCGFPFFIEFGQTTIPISDQVFDITVIITGLVFFIWYKYSHKSFFAKEPAFKKMALVCNVDKYHFLYQKATHQLNQNKDAVRKTFKLSKYIFMIFVINSIEDDIKGIFISHLSNLKLWSIFIWIILTLLFTLLHFSHIIGKIITIFININAKTNSIIDTCIKHGMFVKNYTLLYSTIKVLEENDLKK